MMSVIGLTTGLSSFERAWKRFSFNHLFPHIFLKQKRFWAVGMYEYLHKCLLLQDFLERIKTRKTFKTLV